ncbi:hypothetical protein [Pseudomonas typographi]|uniref:Uncharacterized protein n=1 Tax=Pseudomonas typographi TaxID=2715964 RepID=A0ABR7ZAJ1_9PSED|nr:hypothetical protein [Pseudomonas typographi]MBD1555207.1 hypothetical protein [Pseudomonas typographi]MBD1602445.1 hypothetical protein [Pseudomonas typographi]
MATIRSLARNLPADPDMQGWVQGWAVVQNAPWRFINIHASKEAAGAEASQLGPGYRVSYGSHRLGTDDFIGSDPLDG